MINDPGNENWGSGILTSFFKSFSTLCAIVSSLTAWKTSRIVKLSDLKRKGKIGTRLHAKALKATIDFRERQPKLTVQKHRKNTNNK